MPQYKKLTNESKYKFNQMIEEALIDDRILVKIDDRIKNALVPTTVYFSQIEVCYWMTCCFNLTTL